MEKKNASVQGKLYTTDEICKMLREVLAEIVIETTNDENGNVGMVELLVGAKFIGKFEEKIGKMHE